jgi:hypothetical protein
MRILEEGQLKGAFEGFRNWDTVFEFFAGGKWKQNEYRYHYQYAFMPHAKVVEESGQMLLYVDGIADPIQVVRVY